MRGHIQKRGKQSWRISVSLGKGPDGKYKYYRETVRGTKKDAEERLAEVLVELRNERLVTPERITLATLLERWLEDYVQPNKTPNTYRYYSGISRDYLIPHIGQVQVQKLKSIHIQQLYSRLLKDGGKSGKGLSPKTVKHVHTTLSAALSYALKHRIIRHNPCQDVTPPKNARKAPKVWNREEVARVMKALPGERYGIYFALVLYTGLRVSEALALRWENVDLDSRVVTVCEAIKNFKNLATAEHGETKTAAGMRRVPFGDELERWLRKHRATQAQEKLAMGSKYQDRGLVIATQTGNHVHVSNLRNRTMKRIAAAANVPEIPLKNLRHTHATLLLSAGVHPKVVQERLGHSDISVTLNTYSAVLPSIQEAAVGTLEDYIRSQGNQ